MCAVMSPPFGSIYTNNYKRDERRGVKMDKFLLKSLSELFCFMLESESLTDDTNLDKIEFKSIISEQEKKAIEQVRLAIKHLIDVHVESAFDKTKKDANYKQALHYIVFTKVLDDLITQADLLASYETEGLKALEEIHTETGKTYQRLMIENFLTLG